MGAVLGAFSVANWVSELVH
uniref:Uncharacterized protein n=1 Tax=Anguilla anguilla TaxID=7936 RepID=A0A0E9PT49_ANGAN